MTQKKRRSPWRSLKDAGTLPATGYVGTISGGGGHYTTKKGRLVRLDSHKAEMDAIRKQQAKWPKAKKGGRYTWTLTLLFGYAVPARKGKKTPCPSTGLT